MGPAIIGSSSVQINVLVNTFFATSIYDPVRGMDGATSWLQFAFRFMQLPLGLFGVAIATATLPAIGRSAASGNTEEFRETLARSLGLVFVLTVPSSVGLIVMGRSIIGAIYEGRRFEAYDTQQTALALACYALGLAGYAAVKILTPAFYVMKDSRTPMLVSLASIVINVGVAYAMVHTFRLSQSRRQMPRALSQPFTRARYPMLCDGRPGRLPHVEPTQCSLPRTKHGLSSTFSLKLQGGEPTPGHFATRKVRVPKKESTRQ
jgi:putative peptidoglycan lipid II flippase